MSNPSTTARGYGYLHQQLRRQWAPLVRAGRVNCARCGKLIERGDEWDLGHDDDDRRKYTGPEHQSCNRRAGQAKATANRRAATGAAGTSDSGHALGCVPVPVDLDALPYGELVGGCSCGREPQWRPMTDWAELERRRKADERLVR